MRYVSLNHQFPRVKAFIPRTLRSGQVNPALVVLLLSWRFDSGHRDVRMALNELSLQSIRICGDFQDATHFTRPSWTVKDQEVVCMEEESTMRGLQRNG